jgi:hypothetical protein
LQGFYTDKVDIWSMGCILHELLTGQRAFLSDGAALEHYTSNLHFSFKSDDAFQTDSIRTLLNEMFSLDPATRPSASFLRSTFLQYYRKSDEKRNAETVAVDRTSSTSRSGMVDDEWDGGAPWTTLDEDLGPVTFSLDGEKQVTDCTIVKAIVNKPNSRIALLCIDENDDCLVVILCSVSGSVIWEDKDPAISMPFKTLAIPSFSSDGTHLIVYIHSKLNVINAKTGTVQLSLFLGDNVIPSAIALSNNAKSIAIHTSTKVLESDGNGGLYKLRIRDGHTAHTVHRIWLDHPGVRLGYIVNGHRLGACTCVGDWRTGFSALGYDVNERAKIFGFPFAPSAWDFRESWCDSIKVGDEECYVFVARRLGGGDQDIQVVGSGGHRKGGLSCGGAITTFLQDRVVFVNEKHELYSWSPEKREVQVASLECQSGVPLLLESIKGMALSGTQVILVQNNGCFLVYDRSH